MLAVAGAAGGEGPRLGHRLPEEVGRLARDRLAGQGPAPGGGDRLGHVGVHVQALQLILAHGQGLDEASLGEAVAHIDPALVACSLRQVVERLAHAAELDVQHGLHVRGRARRGPIVGPGGQALGHLQRLIAAGVGMHVQQAGEQLVQSVERRPDPAVLVQPLEEGHGKGADIAALRQGLLALGHDCDDVVPAHLQLRIAGRGPPQCAGRQVVAGEVAAQLAVGRLPAAQRLGVRGQARVEAEGVQQPVGVDAPDEGQVPAMRLQQRPLAQAHVGQVEHPHALGRHDVRPLGAERPHRRLGAPRRRQRRRRGCQPQGQGAARKAGASAGGVHGVPICMSIYRWNGFYQLTPRRQHPGCALDAAGRVRFDGRSRIAPTSGRIRAGSSRGATPAISSPGTPA